MTRFPLSFAALLLAMAGAAPVSAQQPASTAPPIAPSTGDPTMMMTVFMRHDQSKNLKEINDTIHKQGYFDQFPPAGVEVVSWYVVMGIGQIVTLRFPPEKLREINVVLENTMWGPYRTDFYPTYDFKTVYEQQRKMMQARPKPQ